MMLRQPAWLILAVPSIVWFVLALRKRPSTGVSPLGRLRAAGTTWRIRLWWLPEAFLFSFFCLLAFLLAGPQRDLDPGNETGEGLAIAITMDRSGSMSAIIPYQGKEITRLEGVKEVTRDFLSHREKDQFALITFARYPETNTPLTANREILENFLDLISVPTNQSEDGTAIGDALVLASARLSQNGLKKGIIILLTDGQNNQGVKSPEEGAEIAQKEGIAVYCVGLGGSGYILQNTALGQIRQGVPENIDENALTEIAEKTGGRYYHAKNLDDLKEFYQDIAKRETQKLNLGRPHVTELNIEAGLWGLLILLSCSLIARYWLLRRMDS